MDLVDTPTGKSGVSQRGAWWIRPLERVVLAREGGLVDTPTGKSGVSQRGGLGGYAHWKEWC